MSPMSDYTSHLFSYLPPTQITTLSCGHVIPKQNLLAMPVTKGPTGVELEFVYGKRDTDVMIDELGRALLNLCRVTPDGVVVFFPSYAYLETVVTRWSVSPSSSAASRSASSTTASKSIFDRLSDRKALFRESKVSTGTEDVLQEYAAAIDAGKGGLLLSVVGGKMSEGINFSDRLGRGVIIVGLPFPNANSAEWKAKMEYIEGATMERLSAPTPGIDTESDVSCSAALALEKGVVVGKKRLSEAEKKASAKAAGREFYENGCMRAVNQSIGRAIRHREDYAVIVLLDKRFENARIRDKLPGWIREGLVSGGGNAGFGEVMGGVGGFFRRRS